MIRERLSERGIWREGCRERVSERERERERGETQYQLCCNMTKQRDIGNQV